VVEGTLERQSEVHMKEIESLELQVLMEGKYMSGS
jgi:hypothetical protein